MPAAEQPDRRVLEAVGRRRHEDDRDALVLRRVWIRTAREPDPVRVVGAGGEHFVAVDDVLVAVAHGTGSQRREVGARARLRVADREVDLAAEDPREERRLLLGAPVAHQRRPHRVQRHERERRASAVALLEEEVLLERRAPLPSVLLRPPDAEPPVLAETPDERAVRGTDFGEQLDGTGGRPMVTGPGQAARRHCRAGRTATEMPASPGSSEADWRFSSSCSSPLSRTR